MISLAQRLRERKLVQWGLAYLAGAWVLLQVADLVGDQFDWPPALLRSITVLLGVGFFAALVLAWYHGEKGQQRATGPELLMLAGILAAAGAAVTFVGVGTEPDASAAAVHMAVKAQAPPALSPVSEQKSIAVLPFANTSGDPENEHFSDGLTDELISALGRIHALKVAARTSAFALKGKGLHIRAVGDTLGVSTVLEGSVRRAGDQLRVAVQLVDANSGYHLWSATYDRELKDIFAVQEEIAQAIVSALQVKLGAREQNSLAPAYTSNTAAYTLYLRGNHFLNRGTEESLREAITLFQSAIRKDPTYAPAYAMLSHAYVRLGIFYVAPGEAFPRARQAAQEALRIDQSLADAHVSLAFIKTEYDWKWRDAEADFHRALQLNPGYAGAHQWYQNLLRVLGRFDEAIQHGRRSVELDPLSPITVHDLAYTFYYGRRFPEAVRYFREALQLDPSVPVIHMRLGMAYEQLGMFNDAIASAGRAVEIAGRRPVMLAALGRIYASAGQMPEAQQIAQELERRSESEHIDGVYMAAVYTGLGRADDAIAALNRAYEERSPNLVSLKVHPWHDPLRQDPRFARLLKRMDLE